MTEENYNRRKLKALESIAESLSVIAKVLKSDPEQDDLEIIEDIKNSIYLDQ